MNQEDAMSESQLIPANEYLLSTGHNNGGRCEKCWTEAAWLYAGGQGEYESHMEAYYAVMDRYQSEALRALAGPGKEEGHE
jgi:hypothetical protein